jgi:hypothetical protein
MDSDVLIIGLEINDVGLGRRITAFHNSRHIKPRHGHIILKEGEASSPGLLPLDFFLAVMRDPISRPPAVRIAQGIHLGINTGSLAMFTAILRASSLLSNLAAERRHLEIDIGQLLPGAVRHDEGRANILDNPRRREAARCRYCYLRKPSCLIGPAGS